jgi:hypothetical protein
MRGRFSVLVADISVSLLSTVVAQRSRRKNGVPRVRGGYPDAGIHGLRPVRPGDDRVGVQLGDLGNVVREPGHSQQDVGERGGVRRRATAVPEQQRGGVHVTDHAIGVGVGERREPGNVISEHLGGHAAQNEHHQRAEYRFLHHPDQYLDAAAEHRLHEHPVELVPEGGGQLVVRRPDLVLAVQVELDRPGVALVDQPGHLSLEHRRVAERGGRRDSLCGAGGRPGRHQRDPVAGQHVPDRG